MAMNYNTPSNLREEILVLVKQNKRDQEISQILNLSLRHTFHVRSKILGIVFYGEKKVCKKCGLLRNAVCFTKKVKTKYRSWCIRCRRKVGITKPYKRNMAKKSKSVNCNKRVACLRCDDFFESKLFNGNGNDYYHLCPHCRKHVISMERVSI
jgi:hypothetical protein